MCELGVGEGVGVGLFGSMMLLVLRVGGEQGDVHWFRACVRLLLCVFVTVYVCYCVCYCVGLSGRVRLLVLRVGGEQGDVHWFRACVCLFLCLLLCGDLWRSEAAGGEGGRGAG